jgi:hypothetical protein
LTEKFDHTAFTFVTVIVFVTTVITGRVVVVTTWFVRTMSANAELVANIAANTTDLFICVSFLRGL